MKSALSLVHTKVPAFSLIASLTPRMQMSIVGKGTS